jgi:hypothetical protein
MPGLIRRTVAARLAASLLLLGSLTAPVACDGGGGPTGLSVNGSGLALAGGGGSGGGAGSVVSGLVGSWFHLVYLPDSTGSVRTSETTLDLRSDGTLVRTVVARTLSFGFADQVVSTGTWRATATTLTVTITSVNGSNNAGAGGVSPIDSSQFGSGFGVPLTSNPTFTPNPTFNPNPPFGTTPTLADSVGTSTGSVSYTYRIETTSQGTTLFLNAVPFVRLANTQ